MLHNKSRSSSFSFFQRFYHCFYWGAVLLPMFAVHPCLAKPAEIKKLNAIAEAMVQSIEGAGKNPTYASENIEQVRVTIRVPSAILDKIEQNGILNFLQSGDAPGVKIYRGPELYREFYLFQARLSPSLALRDSVEVEPKELYPKFGSVVYEAKNRANSVPCLELTSQFGNIILVLKPQVRSRTTYTVGSAVGVKDRYPMPLNNLDALDRFHEAHNPEEPDPYVQWIEAQVHGELSFRDVEEIWVTEQIWENNPLKNQFQETTNPEELKSRIGKEIQDSLTRISNQYQIPISFLGSPSYQYSPEIEVMKAFPQLNRIPLLAPAGQFKVELQTENPRQTHFELSEKTEKSLNDWANHRDTAPLVSQAILDLLGAERTPVSDPEMDPVFIWVIRLSNAKTGDAHFALLNQAFKSLNKIQQERLMRFMGGTLTHRYGFSYQLVRAYREFQEQNRDVFGRFSFWDYLK